MCCNGLKIVLLFALLFVSYFANSSFPQIPVVLWYLASINIFTLFLTSIDKLNASLQRKRVSEANLIFLSMAAGVFGVLLAMLVLKHKTNKKVFFFIQVFLAIFWIISIYLVLQNLEQIQNALGVLLP